MARTCPTFSAQVAAFESIETDPDLERIRTLSICWESSRFGPGNRGFGRYLPTLREFQTGIAFEGLSEHKIAPNSVLLVDDQENDILLIKRAFERAGLVNLLQSVRSGFEAMSYLNGEAPFQDRKKYPLPVLVLLDIKMPAMDGFQVLKWIRSQRTLGRLCVVMLTTSDEIRDVNMAYELGANSFLVKPLDFWNASDLYRSLQRILERTG